MKRLLLSALVAMLFLSGCGDSQQVDDPLFEYIQFDSFPFDMKLNDEYLTLVDCGLFETTTDYGYNYWAYGLIDASDLSDKEWYWLQENESTLSMIVNCESEFEDEILFNYDSPVFGDDRTIFFFAADNEEHKHDGSDLSTKFTFDVEQDRKVEFDNDGTIDKDNKNYMYYCEYEGINDVGNISSSVSSKLNELMGY